LRFVGHYEPMYSICMVGMCCVLVDTAMPCVSCCEDRGNADGEGGVNIADLTYLVDYIFFGGPPPSLCPYAAEGRDSKAHGCNEQQTYGISHANGSCPATSY
jgi:hypothetical protein